MNNFLKVAFNSTAAGIEPITSNHKSNALTIMPLSHWSTHVDYLYLYIFLGRIGSLSVDYILHPARRLQFGSNALSKNR